MTAAVQAAASASSGKLDWKQQKEEQTRLRKKQNELKRVEEEIHTLETRDQEIDALLCDETVFSDVPRLMELNKEKEELNAKLEGLYEKWRNWQSRGYCSRIRASNRISRGFAFTYGKFLLPPRFLTALPMPDTLSL